MTSYTFVTAVILLQLTSTALTSASDPDAFQGHLTGSRVKRNNDYEDTCEHADGTMSICIPSLIETQQYREVHASSTCGSQREKICQHIKPGRNLRSTEKRAHNRSPSSQSYQQLSQVSGLFGRNSGVFDDVWQEAGDDDDYDLRDKRQTYKNSEKLTSGRKCLWCDDRNASLSHSSGLLSDQHNDFNPTCWVSKPASRGQKDFNATLTLSLAKRYEILYITIEFCDVQPDEIVLEKSVDFGLTWTPFQFFADNCTKSFNRVAKSLAEKFVHEPLCSVLEKDAFFANFAPASGRKADIDSSPMLQDWITVTDVRVRLSLSKPAPLGYYFAVSRFSVVARCKCNGHASKCLRAEVDGQWTCRCQHNSAGVDCGTCAEFYVDRPWARANKTHANECKACNCNNHSRKCRFSVKLYKLSGNKSGGECLGCKHNTVGVHCNKCKPRYTRDMRYSMSSSKACKPCECQQVGSSHNICNRRTGKCKCKSNVRGIQCNRCKNGYQQTTDRESPCKAVKEKSKKRDRRKDRGLSKKSKKRNCKKCKNMKRFSFSKFCRKQIAIIVKVRSRRRMGKYFRFKVQVLDSYRGYTNKNNRTSSPARSGGKNAGKNASTPSTRNVTINVYVLVKDQKCRCPRLQMSKRYVLLTGLGRSNDPLTMGEVLLNRKSTVLVYKKKRRKRLQKFAKMKQLGRCKMNSNRRGMGYKRN